MTTTTLEPTNLEKVAIPCDGTGCDGVAEKIVRLTCSCVLLLCNSCLGEIVDFVRVNPGKYGCSHHPDWLGRVRQVSDFVESVQPL